MDNNKRGIGDNSIEEESYPSLADTVKDMGARLWKLHSSISQARATHTASHGDTYFFKEECSDSEREAYKIMGAPTKMGVERKPNPYEKKEFAGATTNKLFDTSDQIVKLAMEVNKLEEKLKESSNGNS